MAHMCHIWVGLVALTAIVVSTSQAFNVNGFSPSDGRSKSGLHWRHLQSGVHAADALIVGGTPGNIGQQAMLACANFSRPTAIPLITLGGGTMIGSLGVSGGSFFLDGRARLRVELQLFPAETTGLYLAQPLQSDEANGQQPQLQPQPQQHNVRIVLSRRAPTSCDSADYAYAGSLVGGEVYANGVTLEMPLPTSLFACPAPITAGATAPSRTLWLRVEIDLAEQPNGEAWYLANAGDVRDLAIPSKRCPFNSIKGACNAPACQALEAAAREAAAKAEAEAEAAAAAAQAQAEAEAAAKATAEATAQAQAEAEAAAKAKADAEAAAKAQIDAKAAAASAAVAPSSVNITAGAVPAPEARTTIIAPSAAVPAHATDAGKEGSSSLAREQVLPGSSVGSGARAATSVGSDAASSSGSSSGAGSSHSGSSSSSHSSSHSSSRRSSSGGGGEAVVIGVAAGVAAGTAVLLAVLALAMMGFFRGKRRRNDWQQRGVPLATPQGSHAGNQAQQAGWPGLCTGMGMDKGVAGVPTAAAAAAWGSSSTVSWPLPGSSLMGDAAAGAAAGDLGSSSYAAEAAPSSPCSSARASSVLVKVPRAAPSDAPPALHASGVGAPLSSAAGATVEAGGALGGAAGDLWGGSSLARLGRLCTGRAGESHEAACASDGSFAIPERIGAPAVLLATAAEAPHPAGVQSGLTAAAYAAAAVEPNPGVCLLRMHRQCGTNSRTVCGVLDPNVTGVAAPVLLGPAVPPGAAASDAGAARAVGATPWPHGGREVREAAPLVLILLDGAEAVSGFGTEVEGRELEAQGGVTRRRWQWWRRRGGASLMEQAEGGNALALAASATRDATWGAPGLLSNNATVHIELQP